MRSTSTGTSHDHSERPIWATATMEDVTWIPITTAATFTTTLHVIPPIAKPGDETQQHHAVRGPHATHAASGSHVPTVPRTWLSPLGASPWRGLRTKTTPPPPPTLGLQARPGIPDSNDATNAGHPSRLDRDSTERPTVLPETTSTPDTPTSPLGWEAATRRTMSMDPERPRERSNPPPLQMSPTLPPHG